jgi:hypothetical protein
MHTLSTGYTPFVTAAIIALSATHCAAGENWCYGSIIAADRVCCGENDAGTEIFTCPIGSTCTAAHGCDNGSGSSSGTDLQHNGPVSPSHRTGSIAGIIVGVAVAALIGLLIFFCGRRGYCCTQKSATTSITNRSRANSTTKLQPHANLYASDGEYYPTQYGHQPHYQTC